MTILLACDGSSLRTPEGKVGGAIGWAWAREDGAWASGSWIRGTNQRAELLAITQLLLQHPKGELEIQMDSQYALNVASTWARGWARRNWVKADGKPVMNRDIIEPLLELVERREDKIMWTWVKGHLKDNRFPLNTAADLRAGNASKLGQSGKTDADALTMYRDSKDRKELAIVNNMMSRILASPHSPYLSSAS
jgi:ribonuclease HI